MAWWTKYGGIIRLLEWILPTAGLNKLKSLFSELTLVLVYTRPENMPPSFCAKSKIF